MLRFTPDQAQRLAQRQFFNQLQAGLVRTVPEVAALSPDDQTACLVEALDAASAAGLRSPQALAAYALAAAYLGPGFEQRSPVLPALLKDVRVAEPRRVHALNAWARAAADSTPGDSVAADAALQAALQQTIGFGKG
jgi:hypothetical protein